MSSLKLGPVLAKAFLELVGHMSHNIFNMIQVGMILLLLPLAYIYLFTSTYDPFHRGFFCNDQDLKWESESDYQDVLLHFQASLQGPDCAHHNCPPHMARTGCLLYTPGQLTTESTEKTF